MRRGFFPRLAEPHFSENQKLIPMAREMAASIGCSLPQLAIAWTLAKGPEVVAIPGTKDIAHLEENYGAMTTKLSDDQVAALDQHFTPEAISGPRYNQMGQASVTTECYAFEDLA